jgi:hypothetical protein
MPRSALFTDNALGGKQKRGAFITGINANLKLRK